MTEPDAFLHKAPSFDSHLWDDFFALTSTRNLPSMLEQALEMVINTFQAKAGSLFFFGEPSQIARSGACPEAILSHVEQLETTIAKRLQGSTWRILETDTLPISTQKFSHHSLILLNTPLLKETQVVGSLSLVIDDEFSPDHVHFTILSKLARGIGKLASFFADLSLAQKRYKELDLIYQVGQTLVATLDFNEILSKVMRISANMLNAAAASIMLVDAVRKELVFEASHSPAPRSLNQYRINLDEGIAGWVATQGRPVIVNDVHNDPRFSQKIDVRTGFLTQSIAAVPIKLKGKTVGVLEVLNKYSEEGFDNEDLRLMTSIAAQAAIALENANLYQSLKQERDKIIKAQEDVRKALSRNLHDGTIQQLSAISMNIEYARKLFKVDPDAAYNELAVIQEIAHKATKEARLVLFELRPVILETQGLISALEQYIIHLNETEEFIVEAEYAPIPVELNRNVAGTIFSIIQEAINNVKRHAKASQVKITVTTKADQLLVHIKDDGVGFDVEAVQKGYTKRSSLGLLNMKERAELIEGILAINSETSGPRRGTIVTLSVPLKKTEANS